jgi:hypothetical protein
MSEHSAKRRNPPSTNPGTKVGLAIASSALPASTRCRVITSTWTAVPNVSAQMANLDVAIPRRSGDSQYS